MRLLSKILFAIPLLVMGHLASAQTYDLGLVSITLVDPASGPFLIGSEIVEFTCLYENLGTQTIPGGTILPLTFSTPNSSKGANGLIGNDLAPGETGFLIINNPLIVPDLPTTPGPFTLCGETNFAGDPDPTNNAFCIDLEMLSPPAPTITSLSTDASVRGKRIDISGTNFSENVFENSVFFNGSPVPIIGITSTTTMITGVKVPDDATTGIIEVVVDINGTGNTQTATGPVFTVLDSDPRDAFWPLGITNREIQFGNVYFANGELQVQVFNPTGANRATFTVIDISGQVVQKEQLDLPNEAVSQHVVSMKSSAEGIYILSVETDAGVFAKTKFMVVQ